jgi:hypothetical protein
MEASACNSCHFSPAITEKLWATGTVLFTHLPRDSYLYNSAKYLFPFHYVFLGYVLVCPVIHMCRQVYLLNNISE